jgi:translation initiation factor IF-1
MAREEAFKAEGTVIAALPNGTYRVELSNGYRLVAFVTGRAKRSFTAAPGEKVRLQLSPYDLSEGRILVS